ncbi:MAG: endonuclease [Candidatus Thermoplasmatota archaeon]|nr:endonuclease [Candidatus Thermoplasmatota archaeon]
MNSSEVALIFLVILLVVIIYFLLRISQINRKNHKNINEMVQSLYGKWVENGLQLARTQIEASTKTTFEAELAKWKIQAESEIRKDAIQRSSNNLLGKIGEEFSPIFLSEQYKVGLKDFRHLGSPVDFIGFKGLSDDEEPEILFFEIKTSKTNSVQSREKRVRDAITNKRVKYLVVNLNDLMSGTKAKIADIINSESSAENSSGEGKPSN